MPGFDWNLLDSHADWLQKLRELLSQGRAALQLSTTTQLDAVETDLQAYIEHCQVYADLRTQAKAGLAELLSRDITAIIARLNQLPLAEAGPSRLLPAAESAHSLTPRQYLADAQAALGALAEQHRRQPFRHPRLTQQLAALLATMQELLAVPAEPRPRGQREAEDAAEDAGQ